MDNELTTKGWYLSDEGLKACQVAVGKEKATANDIIKVALNSDLRQIARKQLPENINTGQTDCITGPLVLQIQKVRNVSAPLANQESKAAPRMLKLNLTDGCTHCTAIEFDNVSFLNMNLIPGTKVCLLGSDISVVKGCILLDNHNIKVLGGEVEILKTKWVASKQAANTKRYGKVNDDPPPPFTEFDSSKQSKVSQNAQRRNNSRDDKNKDPGSKQTYEKKSPLVHNEEKAMEEKKSDTLQKKDEYEAKKSTDNNHNANVKGENRVRDYGRNNVKNEYKPLPDTLQKKDEYEAKKSTDKNHNANVKGENRVHDYGRNNVKNEYKPSSDTLKKDEYEAKKSTDKNHNVNLKGENRVCDYGRNNVKNEYKSLWDGKKVNQSGNHYKDEGKRENADTYNNKKVNDKDKNWDRDSKPASSSNYRDRPKSDSQNKNDTRGGDKQTYRNDQCQDQGKTSKSYDADREKKTSQDYRVREKKISNEHRSNDEYDRKVEKKKGEKDLWSDGKSKEQIDSKVHNKKGKGSGEYAHEEQENKSNDSRSFYKNDKEVPRDSKGTNKEAYSDRDQKGSVKLKNEGDEKPDYVDSKKGDTRSKPGPNDGNNRNYNNGRGRRDFDKFGRDGYDSKHEKNEKGQSKDFKGKNHWKDEHQYDGDKSVVHNDGRKPVAYDARNQNWFYEGEIKDKKDNSQSNDLVSVSFKQESKHDKRDVKYRREPLGDSNDCHSENKQHIKKNSRSEYYYDDYKDDGQYAHNKKEQTNRNSKPNVKHFPDRDKSEDRKDYYKGKQNYKQSYNKGDYPRDAGYDSYDGYRDDRSKYGRQDFQSRRQQSDDSHSSKSSKDTTASTQKQKYTIKSSKHDEHFKSGGESNSKYSPGKRIPLEILFGKTPPESDDNTVDKQSTADNITQPIPKVPTPDQVNSYQPRTQYAKISTKEIMERSLEQSQSPFNHLSQDILYMQYSTVNQINQEIPYPYQQTIQPVPNFQVPPTSQYMGYNEHPGSSGGGSAAAVAAAASALNPYLSYPNHRNNFQYNQLHTQHRTLQQQLPQQQQTQTLGNDIPFFSGNPYYYSVNNTQITQLHEQYQ